MARSKLFLSIKGKFRGVPPNTSLPFGDYVYQRTNKNLANAEALLGDRMQIRRNMPQFNPQTPQQMANRAVFADGVAEWHALTQQEKEAYKEQGKLKKLNGFQLFMSIWMKSSKGR